MNRLQAMEIFVEVVERGGFARAAHALHLATSTVSFHVANLETHLAASLLNRSTRSFALTDEGTKYYALSKRVLGDIGEVEGSLKRSRTYPAGRLRIDVSATFASRLVLPLLPEFLERYPDISLDFTDSGHNFDADQVGTDLMIRNLLTPLKDSRLVAAPMGSSPSIFAASPIYLARHGRPKTPSDLLKHRCIGYIDPWSGRRWEWFFEREGVRSALDVPQRLAYSQGHVRVEAAVTGLGVLNDLLCNIQTELRDGKLLLILEEWSWEPPPMHVIYPQGLRRSKKVSTFLKFLLGKYPPHKALQPSTHVNSGGM